MLGNIDCQELLPHGTPDRVQAEAAVKQAIDDTGEGREGGGQIIGSSTWLHACANPENCIAMFQAPQKYSAYDNRE